MSADIGNNILLVAAAGGVIGAVVGACIGGPVGAAVGAIVGALGPLAVVAAVGIVVIVTVTAYKLAEMAAEEIHSAYSQKKSTELEERERQVASLELTVTEAKTELERKAQEVKATKKVAEEIQQKAKEKEDKVEMKERKAEEMYLKAEEKQRQAEKILRQAEEREAVIDEKLINLAADKIDVVKDYIDNLRESEMPPEMIKAKVKARRSTSKSFENVFFTDDLRDPKTNALLDDCVLAPDGYYYNRSTLVEIHQQAQKEKKEARCFKDPSKPLPDPATLPTNDGFQATIQVLRKAGLVEALSLSSSPSLPASVRESRVRKDPDPALIKKVSMPSQDNIAQEKTFLRAPKGYFAFFISEQELAANPPQALTAKNLTGAALVVESQALLP